MLCFLFSGWWARSEFGIARLARGVIRIRITLSESIRPEEIPATISVSIHSDAKATPPHTEPRGVTASQSRLTVPIAKTGPMFITESPMNAPRMSRAIIGGGLSSSLRGPHAPQSSNILALWLPGTAGGESDPNTSLRTRCAKRACSRHGASILSGFTWLARTDPRTHNIPPYFMASRKSFPRPEYPDRNQPPVWLTVNLAVSRPDRGHGFDPEKRRGSVCCHAGQVCFCSSARLGLADRDAGCGRCSERSLTAIFHWGPSLHRHGQNHS